MRLEKVDWIKKYLIPIKVHIFWEGHKILWNLHPRFVLCRNSQIYSGDLEIFLAFSEYMNFKKPKNLKQSPTFLEIT